MKLLTKLLLTPLLGFLIKALIEIRKPTRIKHMFRSHLIGKVEYEVTEELMITHLGLR